MTSIFFGHVRCQYILIFKLFRHTTKEIDVFDWKSGTEFRHYIWRYL
ncbi:hypothetical protein MBRU_07645 [Mycolicibacterium brumae DSM 44177]|nr:hypothetical protein MBRU_07645 [Mycolicibacterium brumae DSM 44177]